MRADFDGASARSSPSTRPYGLYRFDPSGRLTHQHNMPVERPTKLAFGGLDHDRIFVTSMSVHLERPDEWNLAGAVLQSDLVVSGLRISLAGN